jgi:hypothetical protein
MWKNVGLVVLMSVIAVLAYQYVELRKCFGSIKSQISLNDVSEKGDRINFYKENDPNFLIESADKHLRIRFEHDDELGLKGFLLEDDVSRKAIYYNFTDDGLISSYKYTDDQYAIVTNITHDSDQTIVRAEYYDGYTVIYKFFADGTSEISTVTGDRDVTLR